MKKKLCPHCATEKPLSEFYKRKNGKPRSWCKVCNQETAEKWYREHPEERKRKAKAWREANPERVAEYRRLNKYRNHLVDIKRKYGIEPVEYGRMLLKSNGLCDICSEPFSVREPLLDHCHKSGKIRGLLCKRCNSVLGFISDDRKIADAIVRYLEE